MRVGLVGYGAMGKILHEMLREDVACIISDGKDGNLTSLFQYNEKLDVIIDFSHPANLNMIIEYAKKTKTNVVFATTGYSDNDYLLIDELANDVGVLISANFSLGVIILNQLVKQITPILDESFDIEIIETHHNKKIDSPSGTAKMLLNSVLSANEHQVVYGREGSSLRTKGDVGVHAIRGGSVVGDHEVNFYGDNEVISLKHTAQSKRIFASGAITAAKYLIEKEVGKYNMEDVLFGGK